MKVSIVNTPGGNVGSIKSWIERSNLEPNLITSPSEIENTDLLVFPGNGTFNSTIKWLDQNGLKKKIKEYILKNRFFIGICIGMHILFEEGDEGGLCNGLNLLSGKVKKLSETKIGWDKVTAEGQKISLNSDFFFMHSYGVIGNNKLCKNFIVYKNSFLFQFHPEKSGLVGDNVLIQIKSLIDV